MSFGTRRALLSGWRAFSPLDIAGLQLWLRADAGAYQDAAMTTPAVLDADPVGGWADQSGNGNHVTQATAGSRPILKLAIQNGLPVVRFDGADDYMSGGDILDFANGWTYFFAFTFKGAGQYYMIFTRSDGTASDQYEIRRSVAADALQLQSMVAGLEYGVSSGAIPAANTFSLQGGLMNGSNDPLSTFYSNGAANGTITFGTPGTFNHQAEPFLLAARKNSAPEFFASMDLGELLIYYAKLSSAQLARVHSYLNSRWAVY